MNAACKSLRRSSEMLSPVTLSSTAFFWLARPLPSETQCYRTCAYLLCIGLGQFYVSYIPSGALPWGCHGWYPDTKRRCVDADCWSLRWKNKLLGVREAVEARQVVLRSLVLTLISSALILSLLTISMSLMMLSSKRAGLLTLSCLLTEGHIRTLEFLARHCSPREELLYFLQSSRWTQHKGTS